MMNNEMNNNVVVAPESQGMVQSIVNNQRVQGGAIVIAAALLGFAAYKAYKYVRSHTLVEKNEDGVINVQMGSDKPGEGSYLKVKLTPKDAANKTEPKAPEATETTEAVEAEVVEEKK